MRQLFIIILLAVTLGATATPIVDPVKDGDVTEIIIIPGEGSLGNRSPVSIPISGYVDTVLNMVFLQFSSPCGTVNATFSNLSNGDFLETSFNGTGSVMIPAVLSAGSWFVTFSLSDGSEYVGSFIM